MPVLLHVNTLEILPDAEFKNGQFSKIGVAVQVHQDAEGLVGLVIVLQCHGIIYLGKGAGINF